MGSLLIGGALYLTDRIRTHRKNKKLTLASSSLAHDEKLAAAQDHLNSPDTPFAYDRKPSLMDEKAQSVVVMETSHPAYRDVEGVEDVGGVKEVRRSDDGYASDATRVGEMEEGAKEKEHDDDALAISREREWEEQTQRRLDRLENSGDKEWEEQTRRRLDRLDRSGGDIGRAL